MRFDTLFRFLLQGGVGGMEGQAEAKTDYRGRRYRVKAVGAWGVAATAKPPRPPYANEVKGRVVPVRDIPHSSTQKFLDFFFTLYPGLLPIFEFWPFYGPKSSHLILHIRATG